MAAGRSSSPYYDQDDGIDEDLRLRTVRTAASAIAESVRHEQRMDKKKKRRFFQRRKSDASKKSTADGAATGEIPGERRNVYVNYPLAADELDANGEVLARYQRNKVRTTKYTVLTFIPKNLYEQFRRVANIFFLTLVILQLFPVFGAATGAVAALPLAFILLVTAIKDAVEDYRRSLLDEEVNTSATTKLGTWRNVNQPKDSRTWLEKLLGLNQPGKVTKGIRRLREKETNSARIMLAKSGGDGAAMNPDFSATSFDLDAYRDPQNVRRHEDAQSIDSHSYPPSMTINQSSRTLLPDAMSPMSLKSHNTQPSTGVVDYRRHAGGSSRWERTLWKKLEVGDIVLLRDDDQVPADIVVLSTSDPDGMCYLETKNLDGETNLKPRKSVKATSNMTSEDDIERSAFYLDSEPPHQNLYLYHGVLRYKDPQSGERRQEPVTINELLLRGCSLRNTQWVIGLVVFTGADTKIMLNGGATPSKRSKIEKETNFNVIVNFVILIVMCVIGAVFNGVEAGEAGTSREVFEAGADATDSVVLNSIITFVSCLLAFQNIVPISLYISIEIVKTIQAYFISQDIDMYYEPFDTACVPKTWNISDDLGQIEYVFSDKTGTLTQNVMELQRVSIAGVPYGEGVTEAMKGAATRAGNVDSISPEELKEKLDGMKDAMVGCMERSFKNRWMQIPKLTLISPKLAQDLTNRESEQRTNVIAFFRALALCHSVLADKTEDGRVEYKAESPDEAALVAAARDVGFPFVKKGKDGSDIEIMGGREHWALLKVLEFNSTRKRMSTIYRAPDGKIILYCKGADSVIYERLGKDHDMALRDDTARDMETFANAGLRTLCIAYKWLTEEEYFTWAREYDAATNATENRDEEVDKATELIEKDLKILGATALEDKLQEGVPDAIETLHQAGIKLWILTGDKLQTAIEIGYSCNLLKSDMDVMIISAESAESARSQIEAALNKIASMLGPPQWKTGKGPDPKTRGFFPGAKASFAVVIDGDTLRYALGDDLKSLFLSLGTQCETVVCCRVSPAQKALTVKLVKEGVNAMTLSIGDGANDVAMIQEANIGCGLFGLEGSQAAMSADYAFGQFRFLTKLLLVHGRWSYTRVADMHSNFFYKNVIWTFGLFWFLPFSNFDATYLYQYTFILLYNLVFTSLPVIVLGAFDQDINAQASLAFPQLYVRGIRGLEYTRSRFWLYILDGLYQSAVVFFMPWTLWSIAGISVSWNGKTLDSLADFGTTVAVSAIMAANCFVGMNTRYWTVMTWIVVIGSTIVMLLWIVVYSFFFSSDFIDEFIILYGTVQFWAAVIFSAVVALTPRFFCKFVSAAYAPLDKEIVREMWVMGDLKDQLGISHRRDRKKAPQHVRSNGSGHEASPMFNHGRNTSEMSLTPGGPVYEPVLTSTPPTTGRPGPSSDGDYQHYHDSPSPLSGGYSYEPKDPYASSYSHGLAPPSRDDLAPSAMSYYSATDLPPASPMADTQYRYADGSIGGRQPAAQYYEMDVRSPEPQSPYQPPYQAPYQPPSPRTPSSPIHAQAGVGMPPSSWHAQEATDASYATALDGQEYLSAAPQDVAKRESTQSWRGGVAL